MSVAVATSEAVPSQRIIRGAKRKTACPIAPIHQAEQNGQSANVTHDFGPCVRIHLKMVPRDQTCAMHTSQRSSMALGTTIDRRAG